MSDLEHPGWRVAFEEAWDSWCAGNFGIGAALVDPDTGEIVTRGRNRVSGHPTEPGQLAGNFMAHAEMNTLAALRRFHADGLHLYTTLEPCVMCAGTSVMMRVAHVHYAATDDLMADFHDHLADYDFTRDRLPTRTGPLDGVWGLFARALPLTFSVVYMPDGVAGESARANIPEIWALAERLMADGGLAAVKDDGGSVTDALDVVRASI